MIGEVELVDAMCVNQAQLSDGRTIGSRIVTNRNNGDCYEGKGTCSWQKPAR